MQPLSAVDAVSPALARTNLFLFAPFRAGRSWKLAATGYLSMGGAFYLPVPVVYLLPLYLLPLPAAARAGIVLGALAFTALFTFVFHLCSRLGFAFFDLVLKRGELVRPAWRPYGAVSRRWTVCKVLNGCVVGGVMAVPVAAYVRTLMLGFTGMPFGPQQRPSPEFFVTVFSGYLMVIGGLLLFGGLAALVNDFVLPSLALEEVSLGTAFRRLGLLIRYEPGQFALYALLKFGLGLVGYMAVNLALEIALLLVGGVLAGVLALVGFGLHAAGLAMPVLWVVGGVVFVPVMMGLAGYGAFLGMGTIATFLEAYRLYFLGGRYGMVGKLLEASTPAGLDLPFRAVPPAIQPD